MVSDKVRLAADVLQEMLDADDGRNSCPECGGSVSNEICGPVHQMMRLYRNNVLHAFREYVPVILSEIKLIDTRDQPV